MKINYSIRALENIPFGQLLIATTSKGLCFLAISNSEQKLLDGLTSTFKKAEILQNCQNQEIGASATETAIFANVLNYLDRRLPLIDLPLDLHGTDFQLKVWKQLLVIKHGTTSTYSEIAKQIGNSKAVRAVARAIAQNPVSLIIPCHRIIGKNGKLTGYRWGINLKQKLLDLEITRN